MLLVGFRVLQDFVLGELFPGDRPAGRIAKVVDYPVQGSGMPHAAQELPAAVAVPEQRAVDGLVDGRDEEIDGLGGEGGILRRPP